MDAVIIRECRSEDASAIGQLNRTAFGYMYEEQKTARQLRRILEKPGYHIWVAECGGKVAGYIHAGDYDCTYDEPLKNILALAVDESCRRCGVGRALIAAVEDWARNDGAAGVRLVSGFDRTGAHRFYECCGYYNRKDQKNYMKRF